MPRLAVVGHVEWVDFVPIERLPQQGEVLHADGAFARVGGGGGVAALVLADMGAEVDFFCALGDDALGKAAAEELKERGVGLQVAWRDSEPTRRALTLLEGDGERTIVTVGHRLEPRGDDELDWDRLCDVDGVYFTAGDGRALQSACQAKVVVASPRGRATLTEGPVVDALVFSRSDPDESQWARQLEDKARLHVETRGAEGGVWWGAEEGSWQAVPPEGSIRDAYGAGDSFAAAFTFGLAEGRSVAEAAELGARMGARALTRSGAP
jgi:ribokinase